MTTGVIIIAPGDTACVAASARICDARGSSIARKLMSRSNPVWKNAAGQSRAGADVENGLPGPIPDYVWRDGTCHRETDIELSSSALRAEDRSRVHLSKPRGRQQRCEGDNDEHRCGHCEQARIRRRRFK
jgi:hypothetical protein